MEPFTLDPAIAEIIAAHVECLAAPTEAACVRAGRRRNALLRRASPKLRSDLTLALAGLNRLCAEPRREPPDHKDLHQ